MKAREYVPAAVLVRRKWRAGELKKKNSKPGDMVLSHAADANATLPAVESWTLEFMIVV